MKRFARVLISTVMLGASAPLLAQEPDTDPAIDPPQASPAEAAASPPPSQFDLNRHYRRLSPTQPTSSGPDQVEIAVLFSYDCTACRPLEADLTRTYPPSGRTARHRLVRIPAVTGDAGGLWARAYYTAVVLGLADEAHAAMYSEVQDAGRALTGEDELRVLFSRLGVAEQIFDETFHSIDVTARVRRAADLAHRYRIPSVPAVVVSGRYVTTTDMAGGREAAMRLITDLVTRETLRN